MLIVRLAKIAVVAALACYALLVAYNNVVDYGSNYEFVRHVLSIDTTFPGNALMHRAVSDETVWRWAYAAIIVTEWATGLLLTVGALALLARLRALLGIEGTPQKSDRAGAFLWAALSDLWTYSANRVPEISDSIVEIDRAMKLGFNWELGPFELWDAAGSEPTVARMKREGKPVAAKMKIVNSPMIS